MIKFKEKHRVATIEEIRAFERVFGMALPASYVEFLTHINGGVPIEFLVHPIIGMSKNSEGVVQLLFGLNVGKKYFELDDDNKFYSGGLPAGILLIGPNGGGDYICLDLRKGTDRVGFWDKRHFWGTGEWRESDLYHVADSFDTFLSSLRPSPI